MLQVNKFDLKLLLKPFILLIFSALLISTVTDQFLQNQIENVIRSKDGLSNIIWFWGFLSLVNAMVFPLLVAVLSSFFLVSNRAENNIQHFFKNNLELCFIETLRAWGQSFLWSFLFIIPGFIKFADYILTPFVVMFSNKYKNGEVDALQYSTLISKKFWWRIQLWLSVFYLVIPITLYFLFDEYQLFAIHPISATLLVFLKTFIELLFHFLILKLFIKNLNTIEVPFESHV